jgi:hypothetical protein
MDRAPLRFGRLLINGAQDLLGTFSHSYADSDF